MTLLMMNVLRKFIGYIGLSSFVSNHAKGMGAMQTAFLLLIT